MSKKIKFFIVAGEPSGDLIGSRLMNALQARHESIEFWGIGGLKMQQQGLNSLFNITDIAIMGYSEVVGSIFRVLKRLRQTIAAIEEWQPDCIITIDSAGFNWRLVEGARKRLSAKVKYINYVAPSVWAYKEKRVHKVAKLYDHQLLILPIEKPYFDAINFPSTFVGHPILEEVIPQIDKQQLRVKYSIPKEAIVLTLLPGSRNGELEKHLPLFVEVVTMLRANYNIFCCLPTLPHLSSQIYNTLRDMKGVLISESELEKKEFFLMSDLALVKSGTVTAELMLYDLPMVVTYQISKLNYYLLSLLIKRRVFSLCNIILEEMVIPEVMPPNTNANNLCNELARLIENEDARNTQRSKFKLAISKLQADKTLTPSQVAASKILELCR